MIAPMDFNPFTLAYIACEYGITTWEHMSFLAARNPGKMIESAILESLTKSQYQLDVEVSKSAPAKRLDEKMSCVLVFIGFELFHSPAYIKEVPL